jgi:hypothetical protein
MSSTGLRRIVSASSPFVKQDVSPENDRHLARYAKAVIKFVNHWQAQLKPNEGVLVLYILTQTYGRRDTELTTVPDDLMSKAHRCRAANRLEELGLIERKRVIKKARKARTEWSVNLDTLFALSPLHGTDRKPPKSHMGDLAGHLSPIQGTDQVSSMGLTSIYSKEKPSLKTLCSRCNGTGEILHEVPSWGSRTRVEKRKCGCTTDRRGE